GRLRKETESPTRSPFQRDRDRIVHSTAFRRLEYKTQVFINHEGDHYRTRLTHTLEVAQIARSIARSLALNEDLVEAIALAHDLGHTPFGHAGQAALNECMREHGGFEHNLKSLRVVDVLEQRYAEFDGLNLTFETREGILKHCSVENAKSLGDVGQRFLARQQPSLEAQVANLADEIAYNNHDIDDGLRSGFLSIVRLDTVPLFARHRGLVREHYLDLEDRRLIHEVVRRMIDTLVTDLVRQSQTNIESFGPASVDDVRAGPPLITFGAELTHAQQELKHFLRINLYRDYRVNRVMAKARRTIRYLFDAFTADASLLPDEFRVRASIEGPRAIADYIAGMTDRYAIREYGKLFRIEEGAD